MKQSFPKISKTKLYIYSGNKINEIYLKTKMTLQRWEVIVTVPDYLKSFLCDVPPLPSPPRPGQPANTRLMQLLVADSSSTCPASSRSNCSSHPKSMIYGPDPSTLLAFLSFTFINIAETPLLPISISLVKVYCNEQPGLASIVFFCTSSHYIHSLSAGAIRVS